MMKWIDVQNSDAVDAGLAALFATQYWYILLVFVAVLAVSLLRRPRGSRRKQGGEYAMPVALNLHDPADQIRAVSSAGYERRRIMNRSELTVFSAVEPMLPDGYRLMAQTSLGEVLRASKTSDPAADRRAHASINSKRLDIAVIDRGGYLALAIEVQGTGHYGTQTTFMRDAVKREALRRAGIALLEVDPAWSEDRIRTEVQHMLSPQHKGLRKA